jgi:hypothetical protein
MVLDAGALVAVYVTVALGLLLLGLWSSLGLTTKLGLVAITTLAYFAVYLALPTLLGWPSHEQIPKRFTLLAVHIEDPDPATGTIGNVYFWGADLGPGRDRRPRAFRLPFTPALKATFNEAKGKLRKGIPQIGELEKYDGPFGVPTDEGQIGQKSSKLQIRDAPVNLPPTKDIPAGTEVAP